MFGYIRPWKAELKVKEFSRYQSVYCGICKTISQDYGQIPRLATTYDMTFLALLILSLEGEGYGFTMEGCILHPGQKRPTATKSKPLEFTAAASILLTWYKLQDNVEDQEKVFSSQALKLTFNRAKNKAARAWPKLDEVIRQGLLNQRLMEQNSKEGLLLEEAARPFAELLGNVMQEAPITPEPEPQIRLGLSFLGQKLGSWVYLIDALDDYEEDVAKNRYNPLTYVEGEGGREAALAELTELEDQIDLTCDLLPYYRDAAIISNIIQQGLPSVRDQVAKGEKLIRL